MNIFINLLTILIVNNNCRLYSLIILLLHNIIHDLPIMSVICCQRIVNVQTLYIIGISKIINIWYII